KKNNDIDDNKFSRRKNDNDTGGSESSKNKESETDKLLKKKKESERNEILQRKLERIRLRTARTARTEAFSLWRGEGEGGGISEELQGVLDGVRGIKTTGG
ncbi:MAG: hypothetical protein Q9190_001505, partial [Brigantiaea leucoxantha]